MSLMLPANQIAALLLMTCFSSLHAAELSIGAQAVAPGSVAFLPITLGTRSGMVTGVQFDLEYDSAQLDLTLFPADVARRSNKSVRVVEIEAGRKRVLVFGRNQQVIPEGVLITLMATLNPSAPQMDYPIGISESLGVNSQGYGVVLTGSPGTILVRGTSATPLQPSGVLNGASLQPGPVAPGEVLTIVGAGIGPLQPSRPDGSASSTNLGGTTVWFDQIPAPLMYVALNQINLVVPYAVAGRTVTRLQVRANEMSRAALDIPVASTFPGIFTLDSNGVGPGAILNQNATLNQPGNPAERGSIISIFGTGAGQTDPAGVDGQLESNPLPKPLATVSVRIGGMDAEVVYAGAAPGLIAGVLQVNCRIPPSASTGASIPVELRIGSATSPPGVTVSIE
jgi:uncharacterized protein (TIGR03437 family)